jgi:23S rRNA (guanosine2251-2'-O)-methyltransferase
MEKRSMQALNRLSMDAYRETPKFPLVLVLDNLRSGLNVGSIFRSADAFALEKIILCGITAQPPHREILKTALGSTESVDWSYMENATEAIEILHTEGYVVYAAEQTSGSIALYEFEPLPNTRYALILGNEVDGVDDALLRSCDGAIEIPQFGTKHSLNVAVAAGVIAWEMVKKIRMLPVQNG